MYNTKSYQRPTIWLAIIPVALLLALLSGSTQVRSQSSTTQISGREVAILVTAMPKNDRDRATAAKLQGEDFSVTEEKQKQHKLTDQPIWIHKSIFPTLFPNLPNEGESTSFFFKLRNTFQCKFISHKVSIGAKRGIFPVYFSVPAFCAGIYQLAPAVVDPQLKFSLTVCNSLV